MDFTPWSKTSPGALEALKPTLGLRTFDEIKKDERTRMWKYIQHFLFDPYPLNAPHNTPRFQTQNGNGTLFFRFPGSDISRARMDYAVKKMCYLYPEKNFTPNFLHDKTHYSACMDFLNIFMSGSGDAVLEILSYFSEKMLQDRLARLPQLSDFPDAESHHEKIKDLGLEEYDAFALEVNNLFWDSE